MANGADFKLNITAGHKEAMSSLKEIYKAAKKRNAAQMKGEDKRNKARRRELKHNHRLESASMKNDMRHHMEMSRMGKRRRSDEELHKRRDARQVKLDRRESKRYAREESRAMRGSAMRRGGGLRRGVGAAGALAGGVAGFFTAGAVSSYGKFLQVQKAKEGLIGVNNLGARGVDRALSGSMGSKLGFNTAEGAQHSLVMSRATGSAGPRELQQMMRSAGMSSGETGGLLNSMSQAGDSFAGGQQKGQSEGGNKLAKMIALGMVKGLKQAHLPEFLRGVASLAKQRAGMAAGKVDMLDSAKTLGMLAGTGRSGFMRERGLAIASKLQNALVNPGGGEFGKGIMQRAMGFGKGGDTDYEGSIKRAEEGLTPDNLMRVVKRFSDEGGSEAGQMMSTVAKISLTNAQALIRDYRSGNLKQSKVDSVSKEALSSKTLEQKALTAMEGVNSKAARLATRFNEFATQGAIHASKIEAVQDASLLLFKKISEAVTEYGPAIVEMGKDVARLVGAMMEWLGKEDQIGPEAVARYTSRAAQLTQEAAMEQAPEAAVALAKKALAMSVEAETSVSGGTNAYSNLGHLEAEANRKLTRLTEANRMQSFDKLQNIDRAKYFDERFAGGGKFEVNDFKDTEGNFLKAPEAEEIQDFMRLIVRNRQERMTGASGKEDSIESVALLRTMIDELQGIRLKLGVDIEVRPYTDLPTRNASQPTKAPGT